MRYLSDTKDYAYVVVEHKLAINKACSLGVTLQISYNSNSQQHYKLNYINYKCFHTK